MMKRVISLSLCLIMILTVFAGCAKETDDNDKGAYITMYLTDPVYNFDPASAYGNEAALKVVSLMFDTLFVLDDNGKVKKSLAKDYDTEYNEKDDVYEMIITLNDTCWSDGMAVRAEDVLVAWRRILDPGNSFAAAVLLYDIKNARAVKEGESGLSIDDVGISAINETQLKITFEGEIDEDRFLLNLTSYALAPVREDVVNQAVNPVDWAKSPTIFLASGPFKLKEISYEDEGAGLILERNMYYYRDISEDDLDKYVTPYRLVVDYTKSAEELMQAYEAGEIFYVGDIPLSMRGNYKDQVEKYNSLSTHTYVLNENAVIQKVDGSEGAKIFADTNVRKALSLAINRQAIADAIVFAQPATGLVPNGVFNADTKNKLFREEGGALLSTDANLTEANALLNTAGITASEYSFSISVPSYDEVHMKIAELVQSAWGEGGLGFKVTINAIDVVNNKDKDKTTEDVIPGIKDDIFAEQYSAGNFEVAAIDYTAFSVDAMSVLAPLAKHYTGNAYTVSDATTGKVISEGIPTHISGYDSTAYNDKIDAAHKESNADAKATLLHEAEQILMNEMPVIPIIFNETAVLVNKDLLSKYDFTYYGTPVLNKLKLKNYQDYLPQNQE